MQHVIKIKQDARVAPHDGSLEQGRTDWKRFTRDNDHIVPVCPHDISDTGQRCVPEVTQLMKPGRAQLLIARKVRRGSELNLYATRSQVGSPLFDAEPLRWGVSGSELT
jgi:hypothetical protein